MKVSKGRRPEDCVTYHAWRSLQDTKILAQDGDCVYYLERPIIEGRLDSEWNYRLQIGQPTDDCTIGRTILTIRREEVKCEGLTCQVINLIGANNQIITSLHWLGHTKKLRYGRNSGTKKYTFDWQGRELMWDSYLTFAGTDHFCLDTASGEVLCYFKSIFWPLAKDGKIQLSSKVKDETTRVMLTASCMAYREWADRRETGVYVK